MLLRRTNGHRTEGFLLAPFVDVPTGNVRLSYGAASVVPSATQDPAADEDPGDQPVQHWSIQDGNGDVVLAGLGSRAEAVRQLGPLAVRGAALPLVVYDPAGGPTGEHLA
jgi:hypothetical protein